MAYQLSWQNTLLEQGIKAHLRAVFACSMLQNSYLLMVPHSDQFTISLSSNQLARISISLNTSFIQKAWSRLYPWDPLGIHTNLVQKMQFHVHFSQLLWCQFFSIAFNSSLKSSILSSFSFLWASDSAWMLCNWYNIGITKDTVASNYTVYSNLNCWKKFELAFSLIQPFKLQQNLN